jgi:hypothetical protein
VAPTPSASTPTESPQQREERLAYEGAEKAYRDFTAEYGRVTTTSYSPHVTPKMRETATGSYLRTFSGFLKLRRKRQLRSVGELKVGWVRRVAYSPPKRVLLWVCEDGSGTFLRTKDSRRGRKGIVTTLDLTVTFDGSRWKVAEGDNQKVVKSCA